MYTLLSPANRLRVSSHRKWTPFPISGVYLLLGVCINLSSGYPQGRLPLSLDLLVVLELEP